MHEMCEVQDYESVDFRPVVDRHISRVMLYPLVVHEIISVIQKFTLDDMPTTICTMQTKSGQMEALLNIWEAFETEQERSEHLGGFWIELTVSTEKIVDSRRYCIEFGLFERGGLEAAPGGPFDMHPLSFDVFLRHFRARFEEFRVELHGRDEAKPGVKLRSALTFTRATMGWSGVRMRRELLGAQAYAEGVARNRGARQQQPYLYDGQEQDDKQSQRLIVDFIQNVGWYHHSRARDLRSELLLLRRTITQTLLTMGVNKID